LAGGDPVPSEAQNAEIQKWCADVSAAGKPFGWDLNPCKGVDWRKAGTSTEGRPLVYAEFGEKDAENTSLVFSSIHGDEITPFYLGMQLVEWLRSHQEEFGKKHHVRVIIAPLVNPDGFFRSPRTRMNARGVDLNRNFATKDWDSRALSSWKTRFRSDPRRYPGPSAHSEPETIFQEQLISKFHPRKILSIHAPLNFMDYDGPSALSLARFPKDYVKSCLALRSRLRAVSGGFFPGSLGNFAGQEMGIPTLTLELPTAEANRAESYWLKFKSGIQTMIQFEVPRGDAH
jgi:protein MpaA